MKLRNAARSLLSIFLIFVLILDVHQVFAQPSLMEGAVVKIAPTTLNSQDDLEIDKAFYEALLGRKVKKAFLSGY